MIEANKKLIKATLNQGVVENQDRLISLYQTNLQAMATQAALISGFAFTAVASVAYPAIVTANDDTSLYTATYFSYPLYVICMICGLFVLSQATIVVMFGPSFALKGVDQESVSRAAENMRVEQWRIFCMGAVCISALFLGSLVQSWVNFPTGIAAIVTALFAIGYAVVIYEGQRAFKLFLVPVDVTNVFRDNANGKPGSEALLSREAFVAAANKKRREKHRGVIWLRQSPDKGGLFVKCYGVLRNAKLDLYRSEADFNSNNAEPVIKQPIRLWKVTLETDTRLFQQQVTSLGGAMKAGIAGEGGRDFALADLMASSTDLVFAAKYYRFALMPKLTSELETAEPVELLGDCEVAFQGWVHALRTVISGCEEAEEFGLSQGGAVTVEETLKDYNVATVVKAANSSSAAKTSGTL